MNGKIAIRYDTPNNLHIKYSGCIVTGKSFEDKE